MRALTSSTLLLVLVAGCSPDLPPALVEQDAGAPADPTPKPPEPPRDAGVPQIFTPDASGELTPDAGVVLPVPDAGTVPGEYPPVASTLPVMEVTFSAADLAKMDADPRSNDLFPAVVVLDGKRATAMGRYRGASTRSVPQKSFKLELDSGLELDHRDHFELLAEWQDGGKLSEKFAVDLFQALGLPVPSARFVSLTLNGRPNGLYLDMEHVGKDYLRAHRLETDASIYRCGGRNCEMKLAPAGPYQDDFEKKTNATLPFTDLQALLQVINRTDQADFERELAKRIDLEAYLGNLAADALISNIVIEDSRSYWVHELAKDSWTYVPWDLNNAWLVFNRLWKVTDPPIMNRASFAFTVDDPVAQMLYDERHAQLASYRPVWSVLDTRIWDSPALRERLVKKIEDALRGPFSDAKAFAHIDALAALVSAESQRDPYMDQAFVAKAPGYLKTYVHERREELRRKLAAMRARQRSALFINEVGFPGGGSPGYVELYNSSGADLDLGGKAITNDLRSPALQLFRAGTVVPARGYLKLTAGGDPSQGSDHLAFQLPVSGGELGVFDGVKVTEPLDAIYFGPHGAGTAYGRSGDGFAVMAPTPGAPNR